MDTFRGVIWALLFSAILWGMIFWCIFANADMTDRINKEIIRDVLRKDCKTVASYTYDRAVRWGYPTRMVTGYNDNGRRHRWVEYYDLGKWRVWDEALWYVGKSWYTADELGYKTVRILYGD